MQLILTIAAVVGVLWFAERSREHLVLAAASLAFGATVLLLAVGDLERAILLSCIVVVAIVAASEVKYRHSGLKLIVTDLPLLLAGTVRFFFVQYPLAVAAVIGGSVVLVLAALAILHDAAGPPVSLGLRLLLLAVAAAALAVACRTSGGAAALRRIAAQRRCFLSAFVASLLDPASWRNVGSLALSDIAGESLPLLPAVPARGDQRPDIIVIQHESIFDPRLYGLPVEPLVAGLLTPPRGLHGRLNVDIFGGGSWQSEFSLLTGLSSASFGSNAYFLFQRGVGRFHNTLPHALAALGYRTMLASSCRRSFLNYEAFYRAIGIDERVFSDDLPAPFDLESFERTNSDAMFLDAALGVHMARVAQDDAPRFCFVLTNSNHGPHGRRLVAPGHFEDERAFAKASLPDEHYAEYYGRLAETAANWARLRAELAGRFPRRPTLVVHYGDHQPVMTRRIESGLRLPPDARRQFRTFYALEFLNADPAVSGKAADLDIAFLGTVALQQAGLPLDGVFATRASLLEHCSDGYFASTSERKRRFHRTLVEMGLIDLEPA
jgi:hypothetical protein